MPVLAIVDSADPTLLGLLDADDMLMLARVEDSSKVQVMVAEGTSVRIGSAYLSRDLLHARFLDAGSAFVAPTGEGSCCVDV